MLESNLMHSLKIGKNFPSEVNCLVEIPRGCTNKYEYDEIMNVFRLDRVLFESIFYPTEYGMIPQTLNKQDGDPLDIMVFSTFPTFTGCLIPTRPIGILRLIDSGEDDYKVISVCANDPRFDDVKDLSDLSTHAKKEITNFWENYVELQKNKSIQIDGWSGKEKAHEAIRKAHELFNQNHQLP
jgi:inorganic pyrophosphatase